MFVESVLSQFLNIFLMFFSFTERQTKFMFLLFISFNLNECCYIFDYFKVSKNKDFLNFFYIIINFGVHAIYFKTLIFILF